MQYEMEYEESATGQQDVVYTAVFTAETGAKVRVKIRRDSYDFQSYAIAERWSIPLVQWQEVATIHYSKMNSRRVYTPSRGWEITGHKADVDELLARVAAVTRG